MKLCIIGAGSTYTPELIEGIIAKHKTLPVTEISLMDIDERKLSIVGGLAKRMVDSSGIDCQVKLTMSYEEALRNARFVMVQIRVGKLLARVLDEKIPLKYNMIGQETCGIGGMFKAFRTIPVMLEIVKMMEKLCPDAWLINFTNPSGLVAQALLNHTKVKMIGLCNVPLNMIDSIKKRMGLEEAEVEYVGLNHLSYVTSIKYQGKDYLQDALSQGVNSEAMKNIPASGFTSEQIQAIGAIPSSYLEYYYFPAQKLQKLLNTPKTRGEVCIELEEELLDLYSQQELHEKPVQLSKRGGARYSEVAINLINAIYNNLQEVHVVNVLNNGALDFLADDDVIEISAIIGKDGAKPIKANVANQHVIEYIQMIKAYERHVVNAALSGDKLEAMRGALMNPLTSDLKNFSTCFDEMVQAHKKYLPQFKE
ncbi:MAG: 6-phospho-beta-glucosidase [Bacilli bacterium]|jgi:6-phospho-beta-glucosidase|nr:6-phospho-beta-glucosidase [Bacilli bacterium]HHU23991.1 6-phospho-beta-glucosidase [Acholeplasmataceae bacterium]